MNNDLNERWILTYPWLWRGLGALWLAMVVWFSLTPSPPSVPGMPGWDKARHFIGYAFLAGWFVQAWPRRYAWLVAVMLVSVGLGLEVAQGLGGSRMFEWADSLANALGVIVGGAVCRTPLGGALWRIERVCLAVRSGG